MAAEYTEISLAEMNDFMRFNGFALVGVDKTTHEALWGHEHQYDYTHADTGLTVRMFSTIDKRDGAGRRSGGDAIRLILLRPDGKPMRGSKFTRVHRVKNWRKNLLARIDYIMERLDDGRIRDEVKSDCPNCKSEASVRPVLNKKHETFMACDGGQYRRPCSFTRSHD